MKFFETGGALFCFHAGIAGKAEQIKHFLYFPYGGSALRQNILLHWYGGAWTHRLGLNLLGMTVLAPLVLIHTPTPRATVKSSVFIRRGKKVTV